ncbi:hypothetical protein E2C01_037190 [Portunus trituberculatus]|uniref:Uncharacterized protein n=1 Tax=Portunus trituberculatus TaxID=210409 RepID=A0A5B7F8P4_PORTR|nr:hypothetical protein [Portunus trituberculatus]
MSPKGLTQHGGGQGDVHRTLGHGMSMPLVGSYLAWEGSLHVDSMHDRLEWCHRVGEWRQWIGELQGSGDEVGIFSLIVLNNLKLFLDLLAFSSPALSVAAHVEDITLVSLVIPNNECKF